jgi:hypothetical protein
VKAWQLRRNPDEIKAVDDECRARVIVVSGMKTANGSSGGFVVVVVVVVVIQVTCDLGDSGTRVCCPIVPSPRERKKKVDKKRLAEGQRHIKDRRRQRADRMESRMSKGCRRLSQEQRERKDLMVFFSPGEMEDGEGRAERSRRKTQDETRQDKTRCDGVWGTKKLGRI